MPHVGTDEARAGFLDSLALVADLHRPLDGAVLTPRPTHRYRCKPRADRCSTASPQLRADRLPFAGSPGIDVGQAELGWQPQIREATTTDMPHIVALYADDELGGTRESPVDPLSASYRNAFEARWLVADLLSGAVDVDEGLGTCAATTQLVLSG